MGDLFDMGAHFTATIAANDLRALGWLSPDTRRHASLLGRAHPASVLRPWRWLAGGRGEEVEQSGMEISEVDVCVVLSPVAVFE